MPVFIFRSKVVVLGEDKERQNAYWLAAAANALAHELVYANKEQIGKYDAWEVAAMIEAATDAVMMEATILSEYLCDEAREKKIRED